MERFNFDADTIGEAKNYMVNRGIQALKCGYTLNTIQTFEWGIKGYFHDSNGVVYESLYILKSYRGKNVFRQNIGNNSRILTSVDCNIAKFLNKNHIDFVEIDEAMGLSAYDMIGKEYGNFKTKRSDQYLMNHIDEGLYILNNIGVTDSNVLSAYCLHPIFQSDEDLFYAHKAHKESGWDMTLIPIIMETPSITMLYAMEYRSVANEYLSTRKIDSIDDIRLSPLKEVNDMLIADKVQNKKDFMLYHYGTHERSEELLEYFDNWHLRLGIDVDMWKEIPNLNNI